jgi:hypothetical protein
VFFETPPPSPFDVQHRLFSFLIAPARQMEKHEFFSAAELNGREHDFSTATNTTVILMEVKFATSNAVDSRD